MAVKIRLFRLLFFIISMIGISFIISSFSDVDFPFTKDDSVWLYTFVGIAIGILRIIGCRFEKALYLERKKEMEKRGIVGSSRFPFKVKDYLAIFVFSSTGRILEARLTKESIDDSYPMGKYVGLTMEEARQHAKSERSWSVDWTEEREAAILAALDDGEKNLQTFRARSAVLRNESGSNPHPPAEEVSDSLWEED